MDDRGVSMPLQYVLLIGIIALLASGLFLTMGGFVQTQQTDATRHGLEVVGNRLASDIVAADRLADRLGPADSFSMRVETPDSVAGSTYVLTVSRPDPTMDRYLLVLESTEGGVRVTVSVHSAHELEASSVSGGDLLIRYDDATDSLGVHNA